MSAAFLTNLVEISQINGEVARGQRCTHESVPSTSWADFDVKLVSTLDCICHVLRVAGVKDGGGMRLEIDHNVSRFGGGQYCMAREHFDFTWCGGSEYTAINRLFYIRTGALEHIALHPNPRQPREGRHKSMPG